VSWDIYRAVGLLKNGELVAFKTDTVPGIACNPFDENAVAKVYRIKNREKNKPLSILCSGIHDISYWSSDIPPVVKPLLLKYWPGSLSVIFNRNQNNPKIFESETLCLRIPAKKELQKLIRSFGRGIAVTSANVSGEDELLTIEDIKQRFGNEISLYLDDDEIQSEQPSTIVDVTSNEIKVIRGSL